MCLNEQTFCRDHVDVRCSVRIHARPANRNQSFTQPPNTFNRAGKELDTTGHFALPSINENDVAVLRPGNETAFIQCQKCFTLTRERARDYNGPELGRLDLPQRTVRRPNPQKSSQIFIICGRGTSRTDPVIKLPSIGSRHIPPRQVGLGVACAHRSHLLARSWAPGDRLCSRWVESARPSPHPKKVHLAR